MVVVCGRGLRMVRVRAHLSPTPSAVAGTHSGNSDSCWPLLGGLILSPAVNEFHFNGPFLSLAQNIGLFVGAIFWGFGCDIWGRRYVLPLIRSALYAQIGLYARIVEVELGRDPVDQASYSRPSITFIRCADARLVVLCSVLGFLRTAKIRRTGSRTATRESAEQKRGPRTP